MRSRLRSLAAAVLLAGATACGRDEITLVETPVSGQLTVDASAGWAYVDLATGTVVTPADAKTSPAWDIGFNATNVVLNGGTNGPGGVTAFCVCQNATASNDQVLAMTPTTQASRFTDVTAAAIPSAATAWSADAFTTNRWYRYNLAGDHRVSPTFDVYLVRRGSTIYKIQVTDYYGPAGETRRISFRYAELR